MLNPNLRTFLSGQLYIGHTRHILTEIEYIGFIIYLIKRFRRKSQYIMDRTDLLCRHILRRNTSETDSMPFGIIEVRSIPALFVLGGHHNVLRYKYY